MTDPAHRTASGDDTGRNCPYCRFPVKSGAPVVACGACTTVHHDDCWVEGEGCAVVGCAGGSATHDGPAGPAAATGHGDAAASSPAVPASSAPSWPAAPVPPVVRPGLTDRSASGVSDDRALAQHESDSTRTASPWGAPAPPPASPPSRDRHGLLIASILVLAVAIVGSAAAILLLSGGKDDGPNLAATTTRHDAPVADRPATTTAAPPAATTPAEKTPTAAPSSTTPATGGEPSPGTTPSGEDPDPGGALLAPTPFRGSGFLIDPPAGSWVRDSTEKIKGDLAADGFYETRWHLAGRPEVYVLVDRTPGATGTPESGAASGRASSSRAPDYVEHAYRALGADFVWEFSSGGRRKYDRFSRSCANGYAVFGATPEAEFERWRPTIEAFAGSLRPAC